MRISDWSSDVCSSDVAGDGWPYLRAPAARLGACGGQSFDGAGGGIGAGLGGRPRRGACRQQPFLGDGRGHLADVHRRSAGGGAQDRKSVVSGKSGSVSVDLGGRRIIKKQTTK